MLVLEKYGLHARIGGVFAVLVMLSFASVAEAGIIGFGMTNTLTSGLTSTEGPWATVYVSQDSVNPNSIDVSLTVNSPYVIHHTVGSQHPAFAFDLSLTGGQTVTISDLTSGFSLITGGSSVAGYGSFPYAIACNSACPSGYNPLNPRFLSFVITPNTGALSASNFIKNIKGAYFATDIQNARGITGNIAAVDPGLEVNRSLSLSAVPEPNTIALLFLGLFGISIATRQNGKFSA